MNSAIETAAKDAAKKSAVMLTPILRDMAVAANWPADIFLSLTVKEIDGALYIDYPETMDKRIEDLEYGSINTAPNAVLRPFMYRYADSLEEIMSNAVADTLDDMGVLS